MIARWYFIGWWLLTSPHLFALEATNTKSSQQFFFLDAGHLSAALDSEVSHEGAISRVGWGIQRTSERDRTHIFAGFRRISDLPEEKQHLQQSIALGGRFRLETESLGLIYTPRFGRWLVGLSTEGGRAFHKQDQFRSSRYVFAAAGLEAGIILFENPFVNFDFKICSSYLRLGKEAERDLEGKSELATFAAIFAVSLNQTLRFGAPALYRPLLTETKL